jgi:hypothetical protein
MGVELATRMQVLLSSAKKLRFRAKKPTGLTSAMIGAIMSDACDRLPVVMVINDHPIFLLYLYPGPTTDMKGLG